MLQSDIIYLRILRSDITCFNKRLILTKILGSKFEIEKIIFYSKMEDFVWKFKDRCFMVWQIIITYPFWHII